MHFLSVIRNSKKIANITIYKSQIPPKKVEMSYVNNFIRRDKEKEV